MSEQAAVFYRELDHQQQQFARRRTRDKRKAFGLQTLVTVLAAADAFFRHRRLEALRRLADTRAADQPDHLPPDLAADLLTRLEAILAEDHRAWLQLRSVEDASILTPPTVDLHEGGAGR